LLEDGEIEAKALHFEARKLGIRDTRSGVTLMLQIDKLNGVPVDLYADLVGCRYLVAVVKIGDDELPEMPQIQGEAQRAIASFSALCREERFRDWLMKIGMLDHIEDPRPDDIEVWLKRYLGIESRKELVDNHKAREKFIKFRDSFRKEWST
jgi:hypothetical protein